MQTITTSAKDKSVFQLSSEELLERLKPTAEKVLDAAWNAGSYITYYDEQLCPDTTYMIHEYKNRKELVRVLENGEGQLIKVI